METLRQTFLGEFYEYLLMNEITKTHGQKFGDGLDQLHMLKIFPVVKYIKQVRVNKRGHKTKLKPFLFQVIVSSKHNTSKSSITKFHRASCKSTIGVMSLHARHE